MSDKTAIQWTDATWNPVVGCSIVSPGCMNCYAMKTAAALERRFSSVKYAGLTRRVNGNDVWTGEVRLDEGALDQPLRWRRPRRIFVNSMSDLFHEALTAGQILRVWTMMAGAHKHRGHTFQVLTKRPEHMRRMLGPRGIDWYAVEAAVPCPEPGIWLGISAEDQMRFDERWPILRDSPAAVRFVSYEPALGPLHLGDARPDWVIVGGESGPGSRPFDLRWARDVVWQCATAGIPCFVKQLGANRRLDGYADSVMPMRDRKGGDINEWPEDLRVREFPGDPGVRR